MEEIRTAFASKGCDANSLSGSPGFVSPTTGAYLGSAAAATGILESDLIVSINGTPIATVEAMVTALSAASGDVTFGISRRQASYNVVHPHFQWRKRDRPRHPLRRPRKSATRPAIHPSPR